MKRDFDIAIIGAGMAGAGIAAAIGGEARILLVEAESQPGFHSTGRSAAFWSECYGGPLVQPLTSASGPWLDSPPADFAETGFLSPRGAIHLADAGGEAALAELEAEFAGSGVPLEALDRPALTKRITGLRSGWERGLCEPSCADIDVARLHAAFLRRVRRTGGEIACDAALLGAERRDGRWRLETRAGDFTADILVDAAGAWADEVAALAGEPRIGIQPYRRTIAQLAVDPEPPADLPLVIDALGRFYFKPESGGRLWLSPHDETACPASDCAAEEIDVALAIDRLQRVVDWRVERVERRWAGLRSFAPDRLPVYGFGRTPGFFWCAGQGGFGIQTAPAASFLAAGLLLGREAEGPGAGIDPAPYEASRFLN